MTSPKESLVELRPGDPAPSFSLQNQSGTTYSLADFRGKQKVILAFYPKDMTPGCTKEMCDFSDNLHRFAQAETIVFGISCDDLVSHRQFADEYNLTISLLADTDGSVGRSYGALREGRFMPDRILYVIDKEGTIRHVVEGMPDNEELLELIKVT